ncbi:hypothetical protein QO004_005006 [Rhizobium mesoamericanum]|nr:hypothetical protein [Rhizobium mesoamericanum]
MLRSTLLPTPGVDRARWLLELIRARSGESGDFEVEACDAKGRIALPSVADRANSLIGTVRKWWPSSRM